MNYDGLLQFFLGSGRGVCTLLLTLFTLTEATSIYKFPPSWIPAKVVGLMQKKGKAGKSFRFAKEPVSNSNFGGRKDGEISNSFKETFLII